MPVIVLHRLWCVGSAPMGWRGGIVEPDQCFAVANPEQNETVANSVWPLRRWLGATSRKLHPVFASMFITGAVQREQRLQLIVGHGNYPAVILSQTDR